MGHLISMFRYGTSDFRNSFPNKYRSVLLNKNVLFTRLFYISALVLVGQERLLLWTLCSIRCKQKKWLTFINLSLIYEHKDVQWCKLRYSSVLFFLFCQVIRHECLLKALVSYATAGNFLSLTKTLPMS